MLKKTIIGCVLSSCVMLSSGAVANVNNHSVSIGYSQGKVQDFKNIRGVNVQYRYEWDSPLGVIGSLTYMKGDESYSLGAGNNSYNGKIDMKYYSVLAGPSYRLNDYFSFYALAGLAHTSVEAEVMMPTFYTGTIKESKNSLAYGVGVSINPSDNLSVNLGYEGTSVKYIDNVSINGFNVGIGYHF